VRIGARNELPRLHQPLLGKIEMKNAVARRGVVRLLHVVGGRERAADRGLLFVFGFPVKTK
jgi:hypothetical protein